MEVTSISGALSGVSGLHFYSAPIDFLIAVDGDDGESISESNG